MTSYTVSPAAREDLLEVVGYIATHDAEAAARIRDALLAAFDRLAGRPALGHARPDLTTRPVRFWGVGRRYTVVYRDEGGHLEIVRVFGPGRDVASLLA
jgi:plasmid stabilization system protein ParE